MSRLEQKQRTGPSGPRFQDIAADVMLDACGAIYLACSAMDTVSYHFKARACR